MASTFPTSLDTFTNPTATSLLTSPSHAQQHSDINDAVEALETKVAIGNTVLGSYTSYTPNLTNWTIGNGTIVSAYARVNNFVHYYGIFTMGSTSVASANPLLQLPITAGSPFNADGMPYGLAMYKDVSASVTYMGHTIFDTSTGVKMMCQEAGSTYVSGTTVSGAVRPMVWAVGDWLSWNLTYKAA